MKKRLILLGFLILLLGVATLVYVGQYRQSTQRLFYSGTIEAAARSNLSFQVTGRVAEVLVDEGHEVQKAQILARLDPEEFVARRDQARANYQKSIESLNQLEGLLALYRSTLPAGVARAEAVVGALQANLAELEAGYRTQEVERARLSVAAARSTLDEAKRNKERSDVLFRQGTLSEKERDAVVLRFETALKEHERAKEAYTLMKEGFRKESVSAARARLAEGQAALVEAKGSLKKIEMTENEIDGAKAQVDSARSALVLAELQLGYTELRAPFKGMVTSRNLEPGEVVSPGREVISVSDLSTVDLKIFVEETEIGKIAPGQQAEVRIDTFPGKAYPGIVSYISPEAEFTPKIIQTHKERVKLVYLVKIAVANPGLELKPGMPADAWFKE